MEETRKVRMAEITNIVMGELCRRCREKCMLAMERNLIKGDCDHPPPHDGRIREGTLKSFVGKGTLSRGLDWSKPTFC